MHSLIWFRAKSSFRGKNCAESPNSFFYSNHSMKLIPSFLCSNNCFGVVGSLLFSSGVVLLCLFLQFFDNVITSMLILKPTSPAYEFWKKTPIPVSLDFYFFNWLNPEEINDPTKAPTFHEVGPYSFREVKEKVNITWNENNTVTYRQLRHWYYDEKKSSGKLTDQLSTLNVVTATAAMQIRDWSDFMKIGFSLSLDTISPYVNITKSIGELLFDGYADPFIDMARDLPFLTNVPSYDKFGWFYTRNGSANFDGTFNMATGGDGNTGELLNWNYGTKTKFNPEPCNQVRGAALELYPERRTRDYVLLFVSDICRYIRLDYEMDVDVKGIRGFKYSAREGMLDNGTLVPGNECFCNGECVPSGALNVSSCRYDTPAFVSLPHFYGADPVYLTMAHGLTPNKSKHEFYIIIEPRTGIPIDVSVRLQLNLRIKPVEYIRLYSSIPEVYFPVLWFEQKVQIPDHLVWKLKFLIDSPLNVPIFSSILITCGFSILVYVVCTKLGMKIFKRKLMREEVPLNDKNPNKPEIKEKQTSIHNIRV